MTLDTDDDEAATMAVIEALDGIGKAHGLNARWSVEGIDDMEALSKPHPFQDADTLAYDTLAFFGGAGGRFTTEIKGQTWLDLWKAADRVIRYSQDKHHVFIEVFDQTDEPGTIRLHAGS